MGLQDRDWYHEEVKRRASEAPNKSGYVHPALQHLHKPHRYRLRRYVPPLAFWSLVLVALYHAANYLLHRQTF